MEGLRKVDQVHYLARLYLGVQCTDTAHTHDRTPVGMFLQGARQLRLSLHRKHLVIIAFHRVLQAEAVIEAHYVESLEHACRRSQRSIECISLSIKEIHIIMTLAENLQQVDFFSLTIACKNLFTLLDAHHLLGERKVARHDFMHARLDLLEFVISREIHAWTAVFHRLKLTDLAVETARKRIIYRQNLFRIHFPDHILKHEAEGTDVCTASVRMFISDELHIVRIYDLIVERNEFPVHEGGQNRHPAAAFRIDRRADAVR